MPQKFGKRIVVAGVSLVVAAIAGLVLTRTQVNVVQFSALSILLALGLLTTITGALLSVLKFNPIPEAERPPELLLRQRLLVGGFVVGLALGYVLLMLISPSWYAWGWIPVGLLLAVVIYQRLRVGLQNWQTPIWGFAFAYGMMFVIRASILLTK